MIKCFLKHWLKETFKNVVLPVCGSLIVIVLFLVVFWTLLVVFWVIDTFVCIPLGLNETQAELLCCGGPLLIFGIILIVYSIRCAAIRTIEIWNECKLE